MGFYYIENDNVLGAALLSKHDSKHLNIGKDIIKQIGFLRGLLLKVSYSALHKTKYELWLQMIAVSPSARGKGIGRNMMTHLYQVAKNENAKEIALDVIDSNPKAKKLYEKEGFCVTKYIKTKFFTRGMGFDGIFVMRKKCN
jgi:ribosomal protein S18 acetylase RimI-like enzyme